jgi:hypothetical protein
VVVDGLNSHRSRLKAANSIQHEHLHSDFVPSGPMFVIPAK